jgi:hypothetical protein
LRQRLLGLGDEMRAIAAGRDDGSHDSTLCRGWAPGNDGAAFGAGPAGNAESARPALRTHRPPTQHLQRTELCLRTRRRQRAR